MNTSKRMMAIEYFKYHSVEWFSSPNNYFNINFIQILRDNNIFMKEG